MKSSCTGAEFMYQILRVEKSAIKINAQCALCWAPRLPKDNCNVVKKQYYWPGMKKEVVDFIARCLECQKFKVEHRHPTGLLQPLPIPEWKWEVVTMDFITKLPRTTKQHDSIMVVVDKLTKVSHFIPVKLCTRN
jgi:hypothetical protein